MPIGSYSPKLKALNKYMEACMKILKILCLNMIKPSTMSTYYPLKLSPQASERLWGGNTLQSFVASFAYLKPSDAIGEAWLVYAENLIENGVHAGKTLQALAIEQGTSLLGDNSVKRYGKKVPLLAKFLDSAQALSIQVHPDDSYALSKEAASGHLGKVEAWYILKAEPDASIIWGFKDKLSKQEIRDAISSGTLEHHLNHVKVKAGDVVYNPAGTVHAVGAGILLFEIQQSSDLTYRLYDFNRKDAAGKLRELHVEKALEVSEIEPSQNALVKPKAISENKLSIVHSDYFIAEKWDLNGSESHQTTANSLELITILEGELELKTSTHSVMGKQADSFVLPAKLGELEFKGRASFMRCTLP